MIVNCFAALAAKTELKAFQYDSDECGATEVEIAITHCSICNSDIDLIDNTWGFTSFPLVAGHEIVGTISRLGADVRNLSIGQRVGVGWQRNACFTCEQCLNGDSHLCPVLEATCVGHPGGFGESIKINNQFVFPVPDGLKSESAAPLFCAGITVYSALRHYDITSGMNVGVIGIGGLGHLAVQYTKALGCEVTAFSSSPDKEEEVIELGANRFICSSDSGLMEQMHGKLDFIISTVSADIDWNSYLLILKPKGLLCLAGFPENLLSISAPLLIAGQKSICGNPIGNPAMIKEMLEFSVINNIQAKTEIFSMENINEAIEKVRKNKIRFRAVLTN